MCDLSPRVACGDPLESWSCWVTQQERVSDSRSCISPPWTHLGRWRISAPFSFHLQPPDSFSCTSRSSPSTSSPLLQHLHTNKTSNPKSIKKIKAIYSFFPIAKSIPEKIYGCPEDPSVEHRKAISDLLLSTAPSEFRLHNWTTMHPQSPNLGASQLQQIPAPLCRNLWIPSHFYTALKRGSEPSMEVPSHHPLPFPPSLSLPFHQSFSLLLSPLAVAFHSSIFPSNCWKLSTPILKALRITVPCILFT